MTRHKFSLSLNPAQCLKYYRGHANSVFVRTDAGVSLVFPAIELRRFLRSEGVYGKFEIEFDTDHKLVSLRQISSAV